MPAALRRSVRSHGLSWLWWLALLLPLAQAAGLSHGYLHGSANAYAAAQAQPDEPPSADPFHCGLCLVAADLGAGALPVAQTVLATLPALRLLSGPSATDVWQALPAPVYRSRAPPPASR